MSVSEAVRRIAALKPLVIGGALTAGVALTAGSPYTSVDAARAQHRMTMFALTTAADNVGDSTRSLSRGLHAIAEVDVSRLEPSTAAATMRDMAKATLREGSRFLLPMTDGLQGALSEMRSSGHDVSDARIERDAASRAAFDEATAPATFDPGSVGEEAAAGTTLAKAVVRGNYAKDTLQRLAGADSAEASVMQAAARTALRHVGEAVAVGSDDVADRLEASVATKRGALAAIAHPADDANAAPVVTAEGGPATDAPSMEASNAADAAINDMPAAERISLRAVAKHYAAHPEASHDASRAVSAALQAEIMDMALARIVKRLDKGGEETLGMARTTAATAIEVADHIAMEVAARSDHRTASLNLR